MKKLICFLLCFCFAIVFTGCDERNLFSWAHNPGSGDYESLMSDGQAAMNARKFGRAAGFFKKAIKIRPKSNEAIYAYASAVFADIIQPVFSEILTALISSNTSSVESTLNNLQGPQGQKILEALKELTGPNMLGQIINSQNGSVDQFLNIALLYILSGLLAALNDPDIQAIGNVILNGDLSIDVVGDIASIKDKLIAIFGPIYTAVKQCLAILASKGISNDITRAIDDNIDNIWNSVLALP
ncbi:MAG: hypothetical protein FWF00_02865 [Endomicrobia bacterium]|nr:hypothetical protein [Endomicrobiia bacterium]MCL2506616.1 hypothetical protein [Endomicrobiia bacterium]